MKNITLLFLFLWVVAQGQGNFRPARECAECHEAIHADWFSSMHASATVQKDPLFRGMYQLAIEESGGKLEAKCIVCHSPMSTVFNDIDREAAFNQEGVTCQFCHGARQINGFISAADIAVGLDTIYSNQPYPSNAPHPVAHREHFSNSQICLPCHAEMKNPKGLEVCATGAEWQTYFEETGKTCQDCHMPVIEGTPSHRFSGSHQNTLLSNAGEMDLAYSPDNRELKVTLLNSGAGHAIPTGTPLRMVYLKITAYDTAGNVRWENWKQNPVQEDKSGLFMKIMGDEAGNAPVPPWKATRTVFEQRLLPGEPVTIIYHPDRPGIYDFDARLLYRFAPVPILQRFGITDPHFTQDRVMVQRAIVLSSSPD